MSTDNDVLDLEVLHRILNDGERVDISWNEDVGDVSVAEDITGLEAENGGFWATGVGTTDPEDFGGLTFAEFLEELRLEFGEVAAPFGVAFEGDGVGVFLGCGKIVSKGMTCARVVIVEAML